MENKIVFKVNGKKQIISKDIGYNISLNDYIRRNLSLTGTKVMCREGGCGVCVVNVKGTHPVTNEEYTYAINSCLVSPFSCHEKEIITIEGIGDRNVGYHPVQSRLRNFNGSQCGFCSPGWVMSMYSTLMSSESKLTMQEIEDNFGSNLCRCTGYRPILDALKSFATDASDELRGKIKDIEDLDKIRICAKDGPDCNKTCVDYDVEKEYCIIDVDKVLSAANTVIQIDFKDHKWFKAYTLNQISNIFVEQGNDSYMLVAGNTAKGVYHIKSLPRILIDISDVYEIRKFRLGTNLELGGAMSLTEVLHLFRKLSVENEYFAYLQELYKHLEKVAHVPVRNIGTLAGNLSIKHEHNEFPSDVFLILETVGAVITISDQCTKKTINLPKYLKTNMKENVIIKIDMPPLSKMYILKTYKIMPRAQNAHAIVNAGFLIKILSKGSSIISNARIVYGNINKDFIHANKTEKFLEGKNLYSNNTLQGAISILSKEINPNFYPPEPLPQYRKELAICLFYKFILSVTPRRLIDEIFRSGGSELSRPLSSGRQIYGTNPANYPLTQPIIKLESQDQCSGEAKYIDDLPVLHGELFATFVLAKIHRGSLVSIDSSKALKMKGVVAVLTASDIPGQNSFTPLSIPVSFADEEIFVPIGGTVKYYDQPVAVIVCENQYIFEDAVGLVKLSYNNITPKPILTIQEALKAPASENRVLNNQNVQASRKGTNVQKVFAGSFKTKSQYQFHMETQSCICVPVDDGIDVFIATQYIDHVNISVASMLNIKDSKINVVVRRLGGSYGGKLSRPSLVACACALAAMKLNQRVRFVLPFETNMRCIGKKNPFLANYEVAIDNDGVIQYMNNIFYQDNGCSFNEIMTTLFTLPAILAIYDISTWTVSANTVVTDTASNTFLRSPGQTEAIAMIEDLMDRIALETGVDPIKVRLGNIANVESPLPSMIASLIDTSDYNERLAAVKLYNKNNRWKKKGISLSIMQYPYFYNFNFSAVISVYHADGSVAITHCGIEMGQGINTKVAQVVAYTLGVPLEVISIKPANNFSTANAFGTVGSTGSDLCCYAAIKACEILISRFAPVKSTLVNPTWLQLVAACFAAGIDLNASYMYSTNVDTLKAYPIAGVSVSEVELDVLTGNHIITRVDILQDVGESLSPLIDIGQIEGGFIMGTGFWTIENLQYDPNNGELLTYRTWYYKVPGAKDIPVDFRVNFRQNAPNPFGVVRTKTTGEPTMTLAFSVAQAIRFAITSARSDAGIDPAKWFNLEYPLTSENVFFSCGTDPKTFKIAH